MRRLLVPAYAAALIATAAGGCASSIAQPRIRSHANGAENRSEDIAAVPDLEHLGRALQKMAGEDQAARNSLRDASSSDTGAQTNLRAVDRRNTSRMKAIVATHGWPTLSMVGEAAANSAWLLVQHADHDVDFQEQCLALVKAAHAKKDVPPANVAYLIDRVRVNRGEPQVYGTQFHLVDGRLQPRPIENAIEVEERRAEFGLGSLAEYREMMRT
jgi:hypothetical protein